MFFYVNANCSLLCYKLVNYHCQPNNSTSGRNKYLPAELSKITAISCTFVTLIKCWRFSVSSSVQMISDINLQRYAGYPYQLIKDISRRHFPDLLAAFFNNMRFCGATILTNKISKALHTCSLVLNTNKFEQKIPAPRGTSLNA